MDVSCVYLKAESISLSSNRLDDKGAPLEGRRSSGRDGANDERGMEEGRKRKRDEETKRKRERGRERESGRRREGAKGFGFGYTDSGKGRVKRKKKLGGGFGVAWMQEWQVCV